MDPLVVLKDADRLVQEVGYRAFREVQRLELWFSLRNESAETVYIDQQRLHAAFGLEIRNGAGGIPMSVRWSEDAVMGVGDAVDQAVPLLRTETLALEPRGFARWTVSTERVDGEMFTAGRYVVTVEARSARAAMRTADGRPWLGRIPERFAEFAVTVRLPTSRAEQARVHEMEGDSACWRGALDEAIAAYRRQIEVDPSSLRAREMLGLLNVRLGRYREAIPWLEQVLATGNRAEVLFKTTARAFLGVGDKGNALRVLRMAGISESQVASELEALGRELQR
jgi:tetratricopeptide (TPR) repeat protein